MRLVQPTQDFDLRTGREASSLLSLLGLAPGGGCLAACIAAGAGGLLHTQRFSGLCRLFTLTEHRQAMHRRFVSVARSDRLPHPGGYPAPCSMECGLSSLPQCRSAITRPTLDNFIITPSPQKVNEGVEKGSHLSTTGSKKGQKPAKRA
jgi:hypothetical protein